MVLLLLDEKEDAGKNDDEEFDSAPAGGTGGASHIPILSPLIVA